MSLKYLHKIIIGKLSQRPFRYSYDYGNTKNIAISVSSKGVSIEVMLSRKFTVGEITSGNSSLFSDAIKKALLLYLIRYSKNFPVKAMRLQIEEEVCGIENVPKIYSIVEGTLFSEMHEGWKNKTVVQDILWLTKSTSRQRMASLYALLIAKSKKFESEKFMYLWMAFNGMYGYFSRLKEGKWYEWQEIVFFQELNGWGKRNFGEKHKWKLFQETKAILKDYDCKLKKAFFETEDGVALECKIQQMAIQATKEKYDLTAYGFLITQFAYWLRCELFHGNKPTIFFTFETEKELKYLRQVNSLLEEYLDENLYKWFDKTYRDSFLKIKAQQIEKPKMKKGEK